ncbi:MAG: 23S rRNA (pseudouridine(1915)-N(3))-methyltransferase RlmH [Bradymonadaceae bacterium]
MKLEIIAVGKMRDPHVRALCDEYKGRIGHYLPVDELEVREGKSGDLERALSEEGEAMEKASSQGAVTVVMSEDGKALDSAGLASWVEDWMVSGTRHVSFFIGSAHGLDTEFKGRCQRRLSLSKMTFPHDVARMLLFEQLYRAMTIIRGEPYHK